MFIRAQISVHLC